MRRFLRKLTDRLPCKVIEVVLMGFLGLYICYLPVQVCGANLPCVGHPVPRQLISMLVVICLSCVHFQSDGLPVLERYHVFEFSPRGPGICFHRFVSSDPDRGLHDHPWNYGKCSQTCVKIVVVLSFFRFVV